MELKEIREKAVNLLNKCLKTDREAISKLCDKRVSVSKKLTKHPTIQVQNNSKSYYLGILGILNGIFTENNEFIVAVYKKEDPCIIDKFEIKKI